MKIRRRFVLALMFAMTMFFLTAYAAETVTLDEIGIRYSPVDGEVCLTRDQMNADALAALGTDEATLLAAMVNDGQYLIGILPDGRQFSLTLGSKPEGLSCGEYAEMTVADKEQFLTVLARKGGYGSAVWEPDGYALFSSSADAQDGEGLPYSNLSLSTLYLNQVYTLRMDIIGREAGQDDADQLLSAAARMLKLGAKAQSGPDQTSIAQTMTLPSVEVASEPAVLTYKSQSCDLTLDPVLATIGLTHFTLTGNTLPSASLRYSVNGKTSSRVKADDAGAFSVTVPNLEGDADNAIELTVFQGDLKTIVDFTVTVDWQTTPLVLETAGTVNADAVTLQGLTVPGCTVKLSEGRGKGKISVGEDGAFSVTLSLPRVGANDFTLQAQATGYHRNDYSFSVTRAESDADVIARLQKKAKAVAYPKLVASPSAFDGRVVSLSGQVSALAYGGGSPFFTLTAENGECYTVFCADLLSVTENATVTLLGTFNGAVSSDGYPSLELGAFLP